MLYAFKEVENITSFPNIQTKRNQFIFLLKHCNPNSEENPRNWK